MLIPISAGREKGGGASRRREQRIQNSKDSSQLHPELLLAGSDETGSRSFLFTSWYFKSSHQTPFLPFICRVRMTPYCRGLNNALTWVTDFMVWIFIKVLCWAVCEVPRRQGSKTLTVWSGRFMDNWTNFYTICVVVWIGMVPIDSCVWMFGP